MSNIKSNYTGDGVTVLYTITFSYLKRAHVKATINGSGTTAFTFANDTTIQFNTAPANGAAIVLFRDTPADEVDNTFFPNSSIRSKSLNDNFTQTLFVSEEAREIAADAQTGNLVPGSIGTVVLADGAVTNAKVATSADIAPTKIAGTAVVGNDARLTDQRVPTDGSVTNVKVDANAAIAGTKISPDFGSQNVVTTGNVQSTSINGGPLAGMRNAIINGNFDIWQRGTTHSTLGYGSADRWVNSLGGSTQTLSRQSFALGQTDVPGEPTFFCRSVVASVAGSGNSAALQHQIESVRTFAGQQVTLSFWAKADAAKPIAIELSQVFGTGGSPSSIVTGIGVQKSTLSTSWQKVTVTATLPSISGKTLGTAGDDYVKLLIWFDAGSDFNSRTDSLGQQSGTFDIAQVQIEAGPVATPFERRPIGTELALCQRYYETSGTSLFSQASLFRGYVVSGAVYSVRTNFKVEKRAAPTVTITNEFATAFPTTPGGAQLPGTRGFQEDRTANGNNNSGLFSSYWTASAEL